jgi:hypothetical protein
MQSKKHLCICTILCITLVSILGCSSNNGTTEKNNTSKHYSTQKSNKNNTSTQNSSKKDSSKNDDSSPATLTEKSTEDNKATNKNSNSISSKFTIDLKKFKKYDINNTNIEENENLFKEQSILRNAFATEDSYNKVMTDFCEKELLITDIGPIITPIFDTDERLYKAEDFKGASKTVLKILRNEIFARHGYIFDDQKLFNYFITRLWYVPTTPSKDFKESSLNTYEKQNIKLITELEKKATN